ncbi:MAG: tryptophan--tRNA ligase, partial [Thermodesulfobacteriota bacterium]
VFALYSLLATVDQTSEMRGNYEEGNYGYGQAKSELFELIINKFSHERLQFDHYMNHPELIDEKLKDGEERATSIAIKVLARVKDKLGY